MHLRARTGRRHQSTSSSSEAGAQPPPQQPAAGKTSRLKRLMKDYGRPALGVYLTISTIDLASSRRVVDVSARRHASWG